MTDFQNKSRLFLTLIERAYRWLSITWFGSGSSVGSHWWWTTQRVIILCTEEPIGVLQTNNSPRCPCPCWAAPAAGVGVRQEDVSACLQLWSGRRPDGTDQEVSLTNLSDNIGFNSEWQVLTLRLASTWLNLNQETLHQGWGTSDFFFYSYTFICIICLSAW